MGIVLYTRRDSGGLAVEAALAKAAAPYTLIDLDTTKGEHQAAEFERINPMQQIPAMVLADGSIMTESAAMIMHLADLYPDSGLAPRTGTPAHGTFLRWMLFMATNIYEADLRYAYPARYTTDPNGIEGLKEAAAMRMVRCFAVLETALDPWVAGKDLSIADAYLAMLMAWSPVPPSGSRLKAVRSAVTSDPAYGPVWARHGFAA